MRSGKGRLIAAGRVLLGGRPAGAAKAEVDRRAVKKVVVKTWEETECRILRESRRMEKGKRNQVIHFENFMGEEVLYEIAAPLTK